MSKPAVSQSSTSRIRWLVFLLLLVSYAYFLPRWADWSQTSRLDLTLAIVDQGTLKIDDYYQNTGDYAFFEGHYYLDKAPGPSFLAVPVYAALRPLLNLDRVEGVLQRIGQSEAFAATLNEGGTGALLEKIKFMIVLYVVTMIVSALPAALLGVLLFDQLSMFGLGPGWRGLLVMIYGLCTPAFAFSGQFFSHQLCAFLLFGAFRILYQMRDGRAKPGWLLLAGVMMGWSVISEYPTALIAAAIVIYFFTQKNIRRQAGWLLAGGILPGILLAVYDYSIFHTILPVGYEYSANYQEQHSVGLISIGLPRLEALWGITFSSYRGLFFLSPVLLPGIAGFWFWWRSREERKVWWLSVWAVASFILFNGSSVMWQGGFSVGPRYVLPMLPFLMLGMGAFVQRLGHMRWVRVLVGVLSLWSFLAVWAETIGGQSFPDWRMNPLFTYSLPNLVEGNIARNLGMAVGLHGWASLIPLALVYGVGAVIFWVILRRGSLAREKRLI